MGGWTDKYRIQNHFYIEISIFNVYSLYIIVCCDKRNQYVIKLVIGNKPPLNIGGSLNL